MMPRSPRTPKPAVRVDDQGHEPDAQTDPDLGGGLRRHPQRPQRGGYRWRPETKFASLDPAAKVATLTDGSTEPYDLFLAVPVHRAPRVVEESALVEEDRSPCRRRHLRHPVRRRLRHRRRDQRTRAASRRDCRRRGAARWPRFSSTRYEAATHRRRTRGSRLATSRWVARGWLASTPAFWPDRARTARSPPLPRRCTRPKWDSARLGACAGSGLTAESSPGRARTSTGPRDLQGPVGVDAGADVASRHPLLRVEPARRSTGAGRSRPIVFEPPRRGSTPRACCDPRVRPE